MKRLVVALAILATMMLGTVAPAASKSDNAAVVDP